MQLVTLLLIFSIGITEIARDIYVPALPFMAGYFGVDDQTVAFTLSICFVGNAVAAPIYGPLSDCFGRRPVMWFGMALFTLASLLCGIAPDVHSLIIARFLQGFGGGVAYILSVATVRDLYGEKHFLKIMSNVNMLVALAPALAPILGGYITYAFGWRPNFLLIAAMGLPVAFLIRSMPETLSTKTPFSFGTIFSKYVVLFADPLFLGYALVSAMTFAGLWMYLSYIPFIFMDYLGVEMTDYWHYQAILIGVYIAGIYINRYAVDSLGIDFLLSASLVVTCLGAALLVCVALVSPLSSMAICLAMAVFCSGMGSVLTNATTRAMGVFPKMKGASSAAIGCLESIVPAFALFVLSYFHNDTVLPIAIGICCAAAASLGLFIFVYRKRQVIQGVTIGPALTARD